MLRTSSVYEILQLSHCNGQYRRLFPCGQNRLPFPWDQNRLPFQCKVPITIPPSNPLEYRPKCVSCWAKSPMSWVPLMSASYHTVMLCNAWMPADHGGICFSLGCEGLNNYSFWRSQEQLLNNLWEDCSELLQSQSNSPAVWTTLFPRLLQNKLLGPKKRCGLMKCARGQRL